MEFSIKKLLEKMGKGFGTGFVAVALQSLLSDSAVNGISSALSGLIPGHIGEMTVVGVVTAVIVGLANWLKNKVSTKGAYMFGKILVILANLSKLIGYFFNPKERKIRRINKFQGELEKLEKKRDEAFASGDENAVSRHDLELVRLRRKIANYK